jgi:ankyrin repeat protein
VRFLLLIFVALMDPLTRIGGPTNRSNPLVMLIVFGIIGYAGYWYFTKSSSENENLHLAIEEGQNDGVRNALNLGADVGYQDNLGRTALHMAARYDNPGAVKSLLDAGANPNIQDFKGRTSLHMTRFDQRNNIETVRILLEAGADPNITDRRGRTALDAAKGQIYSSKKKQELLREHGGI